MRVLVVGAGPTGLTAAVELARRGAQVTVVDRKAAPSSLSRAVGIVPASLAILRPSGVAERLLAEGVRYRDIVFHAGARPLARIPLAEAGGEMPFVLGLPQDRTEAHLADAAVRHGAAIRYGAALAALPENGARVVAGFADGAEEAFDALVGADGVRGTVRGLVGLDFPGRDLPGAWSIADVDARGWPLADSFCVFRSPGGRVVVVAPLSPTRLRLVSDTPDALAALPVPIDVATVRRAATFRIAVRQVGRYRAGRVLLAGDAAHCHSPVGGRGMNLGIADAADLAARLADGRLESYGPARRAAGERTIAASERVRRAMTSPSPLAGLAVPAGLALAGRVPAIRRRLARLAVHG